MKLPGLREAGRALSAANEQKLKQAATHMMTAHGHVSDVVKSVGATTTSDGEGLNGQDGGELGDGMTEALREAYKPQPYKADADETVQCPNCQKMNDIDAKYCDQCGFKLTGAEGVKVDGKVVEATRESTQITLTGDLINLRETAVSDDGTASLKIIKPGWGSSGYYSPDVLKRDGAKAFPAGTHMYLDHPTLAEEADRPERSLKDLAAVLTEDAKWIDRGPDGPGLYASAEIREDFRPLINQLAPYTGVSIRATGAGYDGEFDGRRGTIVEAINEAGTSSNSVDFVTRPGAGGHVLNLFEAARAPREGNAAMTATNTPLTEAQAIKIARLQERLTIGDARMFLTESLASADLPDMTKVRIVEALVRNPPAKDGELDREALQTKLDEAVKSETAYLSEVAGYGRVTGVGASAPPADDAEYQTAVKALTEQFEAQGIPAERALRMAESRF